MVSLDKGLVQLQGLKPHFFQRSIVATEVATHKAHSGSQYSFLRGCACLELVPIFVGHGFSRAINRLVRAALDSVWHRENVCGSWLQPRHKRRRMRAALAADCFGI
jgi:hypothetical protein